ncbi:oxygenase MpaB family protein [Fodinicola feengrottensis]|uniref:oxygenase MpaB family protein n=1 Tax=Fodinicola feengrottensis TaxID=435914 RepID=UPI0013D51043|nr:oxygenase MpaB family protein [Fodinicola feengrottensis]
MSVQSLAPSLLGPHSLSWRYAGDQRMILIGPWVGLVQLSLPGLGAGVEQHSAFYTEPWDRFLRSVPQIAGVVYDGPEAMATGHGIRDLHHDIKGVDSEGRRYHALDPDVFYWAHATMSEAVIKMLDLLDHPSTPTEKALLFKEQQVVYARYGVSDRPAPADRAGFENYLEQHLCTRPGKDARGRGFCRDGTETRQHAATMDPATAVAGHLTDRQQPDVVAWRGPAGAVHQGDARTPLDRS